MGSEPLERPILIGGSGSSGTTLLSAMLNSHPKIFCGPEMAVFSKSVMYGDFEVVKRKFPQWLKWGVSADGYVAQPRLIRTINDYQLSHALLVKMMNKADNFHDFVVRLGGHVTSINKKEIFAEKTPSNVYCFRDFVKIFPESKLIHLVRDGRDVVCSFMKRGHTIFEGASMWLYDSLAGIQNRDLPQYMEVRYEDLVTKPSETLKAVCRHIGVDYHEQMIGGRQDIWEKPDEFASWNNSPTGEISTKSVGRYKRELSQIDNAYFMRTRISDYGAERIGVENNTAADLMNLLGYAELPTTLPRVSGSRARLYLLRDRIVRTLLYFSARERVKPAYTSIMLD